MKKIEFVGDIFNLHIIRDDVAVETRGKRFTQISIGIEEVGILRSANKNMRIDFSLRIQNAGFDCFCFSRLAKIVCDLTIEKTQSIGPAQPKFRAVR